MSGDCGSEFSCLEALYTNHSLCFVQSDGLRLIVKLNFCEICSYLKLRGIQFLWIQSSLLVRTIVNSTNLGEGSMSFLTRFFLESIYGVKTKLSVFGFLKNSRLTITY